MATNVKISQFPTDDVLTGSELLTGIQDGININMSVQQIADFVIALLGGASQLSTPSFSADALSDTEIDLTSITYDAESTAMVIQRATNSGFTTGLTTLYSGTPKSSHSDTGLTASTQYFYRIKTTATGFLDSSYGTDDATTQSSGGGDQLILAASGDNLILASSGDTLILA